MSERNPIQVADKLRSNAKVAELEAALDAKHAQLVAVADKLREERARTDALVAAIRKEHDALAAYFAEYGTEHEDDECPEDDTCECRLVGGLRDACTGTLAAVAAAARARAGDQALPILWEDTADEWSEAIRAAHPARTGSHDEYATAMTMVGHRHSKGELVALVTWLLASSRRLREELASERARLEAATSFMFKRGYCVVARVSVYDSSADIWVLQTWHDFGGWTNDRRMPKAEALAEAQRLAAEIDPPVPQTRVTATGKE